MSLACVHRCRRFASGRTARILESRSIVFGDPTS
jgi:hypothetical protein